MAQKKRSIIGDLVIVENRERRLNLEVGDEIYHSTAVPLIRATVVPPKVVEMLVLRSQTKPYCQETDIYIPRHNLWVSDYPFVRRDLFVEVVAGYETMPTTRTPTSKITSDRVSKKDRANHQGGTQVALQRRVAQLLKPYYYFRHRLAS